MSYYERVSADTYRPTQHVQGAWNDHEQHMSPVAGLITHAIDGHEHNPAVQLSRISFEILGLIPLADTTVTVETIRPGRTIELIEATAIIEDRPRIRARAWRLAISDDVAEVAGVELPAMAAGPDGGEPYDALEEWKGGFLASIETVALPGGRPGRRQVWARTPHPVVAEEQISDTAAAISLVDLANGIATRVRPTEMMFPNVDLTIHLLRQPQPPWVGLDTSVSFGTNGLGLTSTTLSDQAGPFGRAEQALTVRHFPR
ncbi:thioesterase family protein [Branchiibius sp. NY16-3462-2]|uniref:thioesterase family protein n=1 Tax=Branchiibius sp. NY16-3462-2 TaxID=1807500 RepID=UPI0025BA75FB|nr:thioesterase family protein [Branchiibius sp. NY16-3462-2]